MKRNTLGKTGLRVSPICIGAWQLGGPVSFNGQPDGHPDPGKQAVLDMIQELGDMGVNFRSHRSRGEDYRRYAVLEDAVPNGYTVAQVAVRYILDDPRNHSICLGAKNLADYKVALAALDLPPLDPEHRSKLAACVASLNNAVQSGVPGVGM